MTRDRGRPYRIFLSGNCQMQFIYDALRRLFRDPEDISLTFRASYRAVRASDAAAARHCDLHIIQVTNLARDPWLGVVPARTPRIRVPALQLTGVFHAFAPRIHPGHVMRGRQPYYLARGNRVLQDYAARFRQGEEADMLLADYLAYDGSEIETAPRLFEMNRIAMRRIARQSDFDPWRVIEPRLDRERFFWSVKHPTLALAMMLLQGVLAALDLPYDRAALTALAEGPEYHEPYHAPIHPRLAARLGLAWAGPETRFRFYHHYFTAAEHALRYITGNFRPEFTLNKAIRDARTRADASTTAALFRSCRVHFPDHGQAHLWYGRVLQRLGRDAQAAAQYRRGIEAARTHPHRVAHRADISLARAESWLRQCRDEAEWDWPDTLLDLETMRAGIARLEAEEARLLAQIRWWSARQRLAALRQAGRAA